MRPHLLGLGLVLLIAAYPIGCEQSAEDPRPDRREPELVLTPHVRLDTRGAEASVRPTASVAYWPAADGYVAGPTFEPGTIYRFDADGSWVGKYGSKGEGPGEFDSRVQRLDLAPRGDTLWASEPGALRLTGFPLSGENAVVVTPGVPFARFLPLADGGFLLGNPTSAGPPIVRIGPRRAIDSLFLPESSGSERYRVLGPTATEDGAWTSTVTPHRALRLESSGEVRRAIEIAPPWLESYTGLAVIGIWEDADELLWLVALVEAEEGTDQESGVWDGYFSTLIRVIDLRTDSTLVHYDDSRSLMPVYGRSEVAHFVETSIGDVEIHLYELTLRSPARPESGPSLP